MKRRSVTTSLAFLLAAVAATLSARADCAVQGPRYVAPGGANDPNQCTDPGNPCGSIHYAIAVACDGEVVHVALGDYVEDVVISHPITVQGSGDLTRLHLQGTGASDVVQVLSSDVLWEGITVWKTPGVAGMRIGDATHPRVRNVTLVNATFRELGTGLILDRTGTPPEPTPWNTLSGVIVRDIQGNGTAGSGAGVVLTGGNGKLRMFGAGGGIHDNDGAGIRIEAPPAGESNRSIYISGMSFWSNGIGVGGDGVAAIEAHEVSDLQLEGNDFRAHTGPTTGDDGRAVILDGVAGASVSCNRFREGDGGLVLTGGSSGASIQSNDFDGLTGTAIQVDDGTGAGSTIHECSFHGNGTAVRRLGAGTLDVGHCWFGSEDGPGGVGSGTGDPVVGDISTSGFVARPDAPHLIHPQTIGGWEYGVAACHPRLQEGIDAAPAGAFLLVAAGTYYEHPVLTKALDIEGVANGQTCPASVVHGGQSSGSHRPTFSISGVSGIHLSNLTISNAAEGTPCGTNTGDETGLALTDVADSIFSNLCLSDNGVTELLLAADSHGNTIEDVTIDGMYRDMFGQDVCGHRSRDGVLVTALPACEGGSGALPTDNQLLRLRTDNVARAVSIRLASGTTIADGVLRATPAPAWDGGSVAIGVRLLASDATAIRNNAIGRPGMTEGVRIEGRGPTDCFTERIDDTGATIDGNTIQDAVTGVYLARLPGAPGAPAGAVITCNTIAQNAVGVLVEDTGAIPGPANRLENDAIAGNGTAGLSSNAAAPIVATSNWWGDPTGPSGAGPGSGDAVTGSASVAPWLASSPRDDGDADGFTPCAGDCNDSRTSVHPGGVELCDAIDNDCDASIDEGPEAAVACDDGDLCSADSCSIGACAFAASGACGLTGSVHYYRDDDGGELSAKPIPGVPLEVAETGASPDAVTANDGTFAVPDLFGAVTVAPGVVFGARADAGAEGSISSYDAARIARAVAEIEPLTNLQGLAADVSGNATVSSYDAALVAQYSAFLIDHFPVAVSHGSDWKFLRCDGDLATNCPTVPPDPPDPLYAFAPRIVGPEVVAFFGVLYGDVTGNYPNLALAKTPLQAPAGTSPRGTTRPITPMTRPRGEPARLVILGRPRRFVDGRWRATIGLRRSDGIIALDLALKHDPILVRDVELQPIGLASGYTVVSSVHPGRVVSAVYGVEPMRGSGPVAEIVYRMDGGSLAAFPFTVEAVANEGLVKIRP